VALVARVRAPNVGTELVLEAVEDGWWYSAPHPDGVRVLVFVTDADLAAREDRRTLDDRFVDALRHTRHLSSRSTLTLLEPVRVVRAGSGCLVPFGGDGWRTVGDARMSADPLSGDGVARALRSALAVAGETVPDEESPFSGYLARRASHYELEARWPNATFWLRRRPGNWQARAITLHPEQQLQTADVVPSRDTLAAAEALLPPTAVAAALRAARAPQPAHAILARIRKIAPLGDRRLVAGLERLIERGGLRAFGARNCAANERHGGGQDIGVANVRAHGNDLGWRHG
jgi:flavin-dependent dehydrogenase